LSPIWIVLGLFISSCPSVELEIIRVALIDVDFGRVGIEVIKSKVVQKILWGRILEKLKNPPPHAFHYHVGFQE
jgi:hypothetical protein